MTDVSALDVAGRRRSPVTMPGYHAGRPPRNKGMQYPADPFTVDEIVAVCATPARTVTGSGCERSSSCSGAPDCASKKRSP